MSFSRRLLLAAPLAPLLAPLVRPAAALAAAPERVPVSAIPSNRLETGWWRARHEAKLAEIRGRRVDLVWLGDSITQDWETDGPADWARFAPVWQRFYGDRNAVNLGFKGDNTGHLLWRMQNGELSGIQPKAAIILIGANNMGRVHWSAPQTTAGIVAVVDEARRRLPGTRIILLSVLPSIRSKYVSRTTATVNQDLAQHYGSGAVPGVAWMDVTRLFLKDGQPDRTLFFDDYLTPPDPPLHPTAQAQARLAEAIEPILAPIMGDRPRR
jgi:lysophospholipase L1-like esterase